MGSTLSYPARAKETQTGENPKFAYAVTEMQGWRISMEDAHTTKLDLDEGKDEKDSNAFFAVYDGHGGYKAAKFAAEHVHQQLVKEKKYSQAEYGDAFKNAFINTDADMRGNPMFRNESSGCTAVAALVTHDDRVFVANAGDSRAIICSNGIAKNLSNDHKPQLDSERKRIVAAGGYIEYGRVNGNLALSRAFGDFDYKKNAKLSPEAQIITVDPEIMEHKITEEDEFLVLACDGIWDCLSSQQVADVIRLLISQGNELEEIVEKMCDLCIAPETAGGTSIGCDNMTIMIVAFLHGRTKEEWKAWVKDRVEKGVGRKVPDKLPQLYSPDKLARFEHMMRFFEEHDRSEEGGNAGRMLGGRGLPNQQVLGSTGGISIQPGSSLLANTASLIFGNSLEDDDDEMDLDEEEPLPPQHGIEHIAEDEGAKEHEEGHEMREAAAGISGSPKTLVAQRELQGEAPPPPPDGEAPKQPEPVPEQHHSEPGGDAPSDAVRAEGLSDKSEDPMVS